MIIGNSVMSFFGQFLEKSVHKFARASERECDSEAEQIPAVAHEAMRNR